MPDTSLESSIQEKLLAWIETETGLCFPEAHYESIHRAAITHSNKLNINPSEYMKLLNADAAERVSFLNDIMIGETYFFRDERQFSILTNSVLPKLMKEKSTINMWSASCASGEEALSLMAVAEQTKTILNTKTEYTILATDINQDALDRLKTGRYYSSSFRNDGKRWHAFLKHLGYMNEDEWQANEQILNKINIKRLNLLSDELPAKESMDIVLFRNTLVYMKQSKKDAIIERIVASIRPGGYLFLSSTEIPSIRHPLLESMEYNGNYYFLRLNTVEPKAVNAVEQKKLSSKHDSTKKVKQVLKKINTNTNSDTNSHSMPRQASWAELEQTLDLSSARARGEITENSYSERVHSFAQALDYTLSAIQNNKFIEATELLAKFELMAHENYVSLHLRALVMKHSGKKDEAMELWEKARLFNSSFWPAIFHIGMSLASANPERSKKLLKECLTTMEDQSAGKRYFSLLEGFDSAYYQHMVHSMLSEISKRKS